MHILPLSNSHADQVSTLWEEAGLSRPWNPPAADLERALAGETSTVLGGFEGDALIGTVMVGHDGHRGWVYYLAVRESRRGSGYGTQLMDAAEHWLRERGAVKIQLMVRSSNQSVLGFYDQLGYEDADVSVRAKWLN